MSDVTKIPDPSLLSPATDGRAVSSFARGFDNEGWPTVHVRMVLETHRHHTLYTKASKCQFGRSSVGFLGHVISERGVAVDPRKVAAVAEWATPTS